jgi:hypothetical protein
MSKQNKDGKRSEYAPAPQVWIGRDRIVTFQETGPIQRYTERSFKDGSVKSQTFIRAGKQ